MRHPTAIISPEAELGENVSVGPYAIVEAGARIAADCQIDAHAMIRAGAVLDRGVEVGPFSVVAGLPQDLSFDPAVETFARIGEGTTLREGVTVNRSTQAGGATEVGENCFLMAQCHVGHDCRVGNRVIVGNASLLAGHVSVGDFAFLGGSAGIHQFCRIGEGVMFGGQCTATMDVAPYTIFAERNALFGLNLVGLKRRGVSRETIHLLKQCYQTVFAAAGNRRSLAAELLQDARFAGTVETVRFLEFFAHGKRGFASPRQ